MRKHTLLFVAIALLPIANLFAQCAQTSNIYSFTYGGHTYEVVKELKSWTNAAACAVERGGYLVEINDLNEQIAIYNSITGAGVSPTYTSISNGGGIAYVWIGATDQLTEGTWILDGNNDNNGTHIWTGQGSNGSGNGIAVSGLYNNWGGKSTGTVKEPDNYGAGQHHAAIGLAGWPSGTTMLGIAGEWNDIIGSSSLYFVIEKNGTTGINDINKSGRIEVYPNPANDKITFILNTNEKLNLTIIDALGRIVLNKTEVENNETINIENLDKGIFFYRLSNDAGHNRTGKFIKQ